MEQHKQIDKSQHEAGGILLGQVSGNKVYILKASTPNKFDKSSRNNFVRDKDASQVIVDFEFANSNNKTIYLGEWHTHPEDFPTPSSIDKVMIHKQFFKNQLNEKYLVLLIAGRKGLYVGLYNGKMLIGK